MNIRELRDSKAVKSLGQAGQPNLHVLAGRMLRFEQESFNRQARSRQASQTQSRPP
jgi:hypothetical protein